ncbi:hypothetical protein [Hymenobacter chitinivorans]|uniref:Roadblock/LAMTOR2 domain-containing protein n=1 Tax=Hymenobacter chitinivorans DSM 11115 TaxID=1121954 RepID=A0A2M9B5M1_9BACT|nr:hypothetical protein [Hymenobacter chitinivorans]PJJ53235.1 hypothetical protein CLV45_3895 [Hymenobacter chitinivorans DSM 11115]
MKLDFFSRLPFASSGATHQIISSAAGPERAAAEAILRQLLTDLPELLIGAVVQLGSGQALASYATSRDFNLSKVCGYNAEVVRQTQQLLQALRLTDEHIEDILITLSGQLHLLRLLPDGQRLLYVVVDCRDTNLALARAVMRACVGG